LPDGPGKGTPPPPPPFGDPVGRLCHVCTSATAFVPPLSTESRRTVDAVLEAEPRLEPRADVSREALVHRVHGLAARVPLAEHVHRVHRGRPTGVVAGPWARSGRKESGCTMEMGIVATKKTATKNYKHKSNVRDKLLNNG